MFEDMYKEKKSGMRIRIRSDPVIFGPPDPDPTCTPWIYKIIFILHKI